MNAAASAASSCAISSSIFAQIGTARVAAPARNSSSPASCDGVRSACAQVGFVEVQHEQQRLGRQELEAAQPLRSSPASSERAQRLSVLERVAAARAGSPAPSRRSGDSRLSSGRARAARAAARRRRGRPGSARPPSSCTSRAGSTDARRMRHRRIAEHAHDVQQRVGVAEGATSSSACAPVCAPPAPAISANSTVAGTCLRGLNSAVSRSSRSSGTRETPTFASALPLAARRFADAGQELEEGGLAGEGNPIRACSEHE